MFPRNILWVKETIAENTAFRRNALCWFDILVSTKRAYGT